MPFETICMTSWKDWGYTGLSPLSPQATAGCCMALAGPVMAVDASGCLTDAPTAAPFTAAGGRCESLLLSGEGPVLPAPEGAA